MNKLLLATSNAHKTSEIAAMLGADWAVQDLRAFPDFPVPEETGTTFRANAEIKALSASTRYDGWVLADDSGLEVDALDGAPGVYSARYGGPKASDADNRRKLSAELARVGQTESPARFRCVLALAHGGKIVATFDGTVEGTAIAAERGENGFGYDAMFLPEGHAQSFAELPPETKNTMSHRSRAMQKLGDFLAAQNLFPA